MKLENKQWLEKFLNGNATYLFNGQFKHYYVGSVVAAEREGKLYTELSLYSVQVRQKICKVVYGEPLSTVILMLGKRPRKSTTVLPKTIYSFGYSFGLYMLFSETATKARRKRGLTASQEAVCKLTRAPRGQPPLSLKNEPPYSFFAADLVALGDA